MKCLGLISGTSADGVDCAIVDITRLREKLNVRLIAAQTVSYPSGLRTRVLDAPTKGTVADVCHLNAVVGEVFARTALQTINRANLELKDIQLIGSHGQTVYHQPIPIPEPRLGRIRSTLQIGDPSIIAERTGITTVADFRMRDMAAGGEGAPLAPYAHHALFHSKRRTRLVVNLGGIGNITYLPPSGGLNDIRAFDTGPSNMLLDGLVAMTLGGSHKMDRGGRLAKKGKSDTWLLSKLLTHPYLAKRPPKSTGREEFGAAYVAEVLRHAQSHRLTLEQTLATSCEFIARTIVDACRWLPGKVDEVILGGGGVKNGAVTKALHQAFHPRPVWTMDQVGVDSNAFEAMAFAIMAYETIRGVPSNVPSVTGAHQPVVLGTVVPGNKNFVIHL